MKSNPTFQELEKELQRQNENIKTLIQQNEKLKKENEQLTGDVLKNAAEKDELKSEQYLFEVLMEMMPDRIYFKNKESQFIRISKSLAKWHELGNSEIVVGKTDSDLFTKEHAQKALKDEQTILDSGVTLKNIEEKETKKNGEISWSSTTKMPISDKKGKTIGVFGISRDITDQKNTEEALKNSEEKARVILNTTSNFVLMCSPEGVVFDCNDAFCKALKLSKKEIVGKNHLDFLSEKSKKFKLQKLKEVYETKQALEVIDDAQETIYLTTLWPIISEQGSVDQIVMYSKNITRKLKAERQVKESEEKLRNILENSTNVFYSHTPDHILTYMSPQVLDILGYTSEETMIKWTELASDNPINDLGMVHTQNAIDSGIAQAPFELELVHKNGDKVWAEVHEKPVVENGKTISIVGALIDITEWKKAEQKLLESEEKYRLLIENQSDLVIKIDEKGCLLFVSKAFCILFDEKERDILGKSFMSFIHDEDLDPVEKLIKKLHKPPHKLYFRHRVVTKDGLRWLSWMYTAVLDNHGNLKEIIGVGREITGKVKTEKILIESEQKLRELNATKDKFFSIIAHDLRSPFNTMLGFSKLLIRNFESFNVQKQKKFLSILTNDMENTYNLLENLLLWARSQRGTIDFYPQKENLYLLSHQTINLLRLSAANKAVIIINQVPEDLSVHADKNMLLTILRNLISNAIKFTEKEGQIYVSACVKTNEKMETFTEISVKDSGVGMAPEKQSQLFKITQNISTKGTSGETGTGLGLILCKEFVEKHGGEIRVESEVWKGSKFIFTIP